jgi:hypothetical protein
VTSVAVTSIGDHESFKRDLFQLPVFSIGDHESFNRDLFQLPVLAPP